MAQWLPPVPNFRDEMRAVQALVEDAVAVVIEPQHFRAIAPFAREHEKRTALRIERQPLLDHERQGVERPPHVLPSPIDPHAPPSRWSAWSAPGRS